ncbi:hypothetical protein SAMN05216226_102168 [Halovenus aranensis]|uniref:Uncharacterized protein n=1 Tax=Halovenus aranensis TaxID=890420 RepID=A0A1G8SVN3_9EURY|nr:TFIIB-type zinc ribbon-containing protein [Halovenus aranensis]SDJ33263.1 hypothetical protein SAMN05216226_102168 [Halovenus aranensis]
MSSDDHRTKVDFTVSKESKRQYWDREERIEALIEKCSRCLEHGTQEKYQFAAQKLAGELGPLLEAHTSRHLLSFDEAVTDHEDWNFATFARWYDEQESFIRFFRTEYLTASQSRREWYVDGLEAALRSMTAIAEQSGIVHDAYAGRADAVGFEMKLGEHLQDGEMDIGDPLELVTDKQVDTLKWLVCGGTGLGKSTGTERFIEDYLAASQRPGRDYKVCDILGMRQGENWLPDVPQQQDDLRRVREEHGLPPSFVDHDDYEPPEIEILHPITQGFSKHQLPFDVDAEEFVVRPFTVPASAFRKPVMVSLLMSRLSESEEATIREVYDDIEQAKDDWSLKDLADEIAGRQELSDKHKSKAIGVLRSLQNEGFIRTAADQHTLDWDAVLSDTDTYSIFSQSLCDSDLSALMTFAYLLDSIYRQRENSNADSEVVLVMRELWEVMPHTRRRSFDAREAAVQEAIGQIGMKVMRQNRHAGIHVVADTQEPNDLLKSIRELFNHYVVYSANKDTIDDIFEWTQNNRTRSFWSTMTAKAGQAGVVGQAEPAIENRDIEFISPVEVTPPSHHHFDVKRDGTGWHARAKYFTPLEVCPECDSDAIERSEDGYYVTCTECGERSLDGSGGRCEELRRPASTDAVHWQDEVPPELEIDPFGEQVGGGTAPDPETFPVRAFAYECLTRAPGTNTAKKHIYAAFNEFAADHGHDRWDFDSRSKLTEFGTALKQHIEGSLKSTTVETPEGDAKAYQDLRLTKIGTEYRDMTGR